MDVFSWDEDRDGPLTEAGLRKRLEALGYSAIRYDYPPGTFFPDHTHSVEKMDAVLAGRFELVLAGKRLVLGRGQWARIPKGTLHSARVIGSETVISLDAVKRQGV